MGNKSSLNKNNNDDFIEVKYIKDNSEEDEDEDKDIIIDIEYQKSPHRYLLELVSCLFNDEIKYYKPTYCDYILFYNIKPNIYIGETFIGIKDSKYLVTLYGVFEIKNFYKNNIEYFIILYNSIELKLKFYENGDNMICSIKLIYLDYIYKYDIKEYKSLIKNLDESYNEFHKKNK